MGSSLNASYENPLADRLGQGIRNQLFDRMKAAFATSNVHEEIAKLQQNNEDKLQEDKLMMALVRTETETLVQKDDVTEFINSVAKEDPVSKERVVSVGEVLKILGK